MNERQRTALAEAIEHCDRHNHEYKYVTPVEKIAEWRRVLGEAADPPTRPAHDSIVPLVAASAGMFEAVLSELQLVYGVKPHLIDAIRERIAHVSPTRAPPDRMSGLPPIAEVADEAQQVVDGMGVPPGLESGAALCQRPFGCVACQGPPTPASEHRTRTVEALLTLIDAYAGSTKDAGPIEMLASAIASLAGAPL